MTEQQEQPVESPSPAMKFATWPGKLALVAALLALIIALYSSHLNRHLQADNGQLSDQIGQLQKQQQSLSQHLKDNQDSWQLQQQQINQDLQGLSKRLQANLAEQHFDKQDWMLQKARFCLELAQINAHWSRNHGTTLALLQQADEILSQMPGTEIYAVRQAIAAEVTAVESLPPLDQAGLLSQLDAAAQQINQLPVLLLHQADATDAADDQVTDKRPTAWREKLHDSVHMLEKLVVIRHHDQDFQPMLSPMYQAVVRESIRMDLQQAQWAVLQANPAIYKLGLQQAREQIKQHFDTQAKITQTLMTRLEKLSTVDIQSPHPHVDQSLSLIDRVIQQRQGKAAQSGAVQHD